jgi:hypothetical protein
VHGDPLDLRTLDAVVYFDDDGIDVECKGPRGPLVDAAAPAPDGNWRQLAPYMARCGISMYLRQAGVNLAVVKSRGDAHTPVHVVAVKV